MIDINRSGRRERISVLRCPVFASPSDCIFSDLVVDSAREGARTNGNGVCTCMMRSRRMWAHLGVAVNHYSSKPSRVDDSSATATSMPMQAMSHDSVPASEIAVTTSTTTTWLLWCRCRVVGVCACVCVTVVQAADKAIVKNKTQRCSCKLFGCIGISIAVSTRATYLL